MVADRRGAADLTRPARRRRLAARTVPRGVGDRVSTPAPGLPDLPANALDDARAILHGVLAATFADVGWAVERVDRYPLLTPLTPGAWVDAATLSVQGAGLVATFPLVFAVDGSDRTQIE